MTEKAIHNYAAESALHIASRSRQLFDDPVFLPDPSLREASLARRKRMRYGIVTKSEGGESSQALEADEETSSSRILVKRPDHQRSVYIPTPQWHAPWKLSTVISSHLGWVRSIAVDQATNRWFATGSADRTIKVFNLAAASVGSESALQYTLTGHISAVRGLAFSMRHPYLFSCGEDKQVKCWDLETNQVVRHYHGHLSGVYCMSLHPTVDVLVTGGRDAVARVWDIRTKKQVHCLSGHDNTVAAVVTKTMQPQVITGSHDSTVRLWDLVAGKCVTTLTHHQKSIRALAQPSFEHTFCSGAADGQIKQFQGKDGKFLHTFTGHKAIINAMAVNDDGVMVSGGDNGSLHFWDYKTGYSFQQTMSQVQPGSLDSENSIMAAAFDATGTRLITGEGDKTIKIWKPDDEASELTHPIDMTAWRKNALLLRNKDIKRIYLIKLSLSHCRSTPRLAVVPYFPELFFASSFVMYQSLPAKGNHRSSNPDRLRHQLRTTVSLQISQFLPLAPPSTLTAGLASFDPMDTLELGRDRSQCNLASEESAIDASHPLSSCAIPHRVQESFYHSHASKDRHFVSQRVPV